VNPKAIGDFGDLAADISEHRNIDAGDAAARVFFRIGRT